MIEAVVAEDMEKFGQRTTSADNTEGGQHDVPADKRSPKLVTRSIGHQLLAGENDQHVDADIVEAGRPVAVEPQFGIRVLKVIFELEDVRVVGHRHQIHHPIVVGCRRIGYVYVQHSRSFGVRVT